MKLKKIILFGAAFVVVALLGGELFARLVLGLGDPPVLLPDADIDYLFRPNQNCRRFGNAILYNDASMRCDFDVLKSRPQRRVFLAGDSVVNGGVLTDHNDLATTILQESLDKSRKKIQVCNVSAGSWGPGNVAAYFKKYSYLVSTNDLLIVEVNSHDLWEDDPVLTGGRNVGHDVSYPSEKPLCALSDGFNRYFVPKVRKLLHEKSRSKKIDILKNSKDAETYNLLMLDYLFSLPFSAKYLLIHRSREETRNNMISPGEAVFRAYAQKKKIPLIELRLDARVDYRDTIHPSEDGQKKMAEAILRTLKK